MEAPKIKVDEMKLGSLMREMEHGRIRVPRFQREFVWGSKKAAQLFDSMSREYPIGTFFLWSAPAKYNDLIRIEDDLGQKPLDPHSDHRLILDGQQRLTALYATVHGREMEGVDYGKLALDLDEEGSERIAFTLRRDIDNQRYVSIKDLLDPPADYLEIYEKIKSSTRKERFMRVRERLINYPFSVVSVEELDIEKAIEIFERINQEGQKLSRFDLVAAHVYGTEFEFDLRERVEDDFYKKLRDKKFGILPNSIIPQALVINLEKQVNFRSQVGMNARDVKEIWEDTVDGILKSIDYLRENWGVENNKFLPYDQIVPVFAHYFYYKKKAEIPQTQEATQQLKQWFWLVVFGERYGDTAQTRMQEDAAWVRSLVKDGQEVNLRFTVDKSVLLDIHMTRRSAVKNGVLCLLNLQGPKHFATGARVSLREDHFSSLTKAERHHIFPVNYLSNTQGFAKQSVHRLPNFCFIPADLNREISDKAPSDYLRQYQSSEAFTAIMDSHLIPAGKGAAIWENDYEKFLDERATRILKKAKDLAGM